MFGGRTWHVGSARLVPPQAFVAATRSTAKLNDLRASSELNGGTPVLRKSAWTFGLGLVCSWLAYWISSLEACFRVSGLAHRATSALPSR